MLASAVIPACEVKKGPVRVLFTGETACELETCVCDGRMLGGVAVLGGYLDEAPPGFLLLDAGCFACGTRRDELLRLVALVRGMVAMGYDAANVGEYELWLGLARLERLAGLGLPLVSANVSARLRAPRGQAARRNRRAFSAAQGGARRNRRAGGESEPALRGSQAGRVVSGSKGAPVAHRPEASATGERNFVRRAVYVQKRGVEVAVTGVVAPRYRKGPGLEVDDPMEALARLVPRMRERAELIVVLADLPREGAREVAERFPEVSLVIFRGRGDSCGPERAGRGAVASVSGLGRYVGVVVVDRSRDGNAASFSGTPVTIDRGFDPSPEVARTTLEWYRWAERSGLGFEEAVERGLQ